MGGRSRNKYSNSIMFITDISNQLFMNLQHIFYCLCRNFTSIAFSESHCFCAANILLQQSVNIRKPWWILHFFHHCKSSISFETSFDFQKDRGKEIIKGNFFILSQEHQTKKINPKHNSTKSRFVLLHYLGTYYFQLHKQSRKTSKVI